MSIFNRGQEEYRSDLRLGEKYRDETTGLEGTLVAVHFFAHACERGTLRYLNGQREVVEQSFDAPELVHIATEERPVQQATGGPERSTGRRSIR